VGGPGGAVWSANDDLLSCDLHHDSQNLEQTESHLQSFIDLTCLPPSCFIKSGWTTEEPIPAITTDWQAVDDPFTSSKVPNDTMDSFQSSCLSHSGPNPDTIVKNSPESYLEYLPDVYENCAEGEDFDSLFDFDSFADTAEQGGSRDGEGVEKHDKPAKSLINPNLACSDTSTSAEIHSAYASAFGHTMGLPALQASSLGGKSPDIAGTDLQPSVLCSTPQDRPLPSSEDSPESSHTLRMELTPSSRVPLAASDIVERYGRPGPPDLDWMINLTRRAQERSISSWTAMNG
jgi:hypothetical protein